MLHQSEMWSVGDTEGSPGVGQLPPGAVYSSHDLRWIFHALVFEGVQDGFCLSDYCEE